MKRLKRLFCTHDEMQPIRIEKFPVKYDPCCTVSYMFDVETEYVCIKCGKKHIQHSTE